MANPRSPIGKEPCQIPLASNRLCAGWSATPAPRGNHRLIPEIGSVGPASRPAGSGELRHSARKASPGVIATAIRLLVTVSALLALTACSLPIQREVVIHADGKDRLERTSAPDVGAALVAVGVTLGPLDRVDPPLDRAVSQGLRISVVRGVTRTLEITQPITVPTALKPDHTVANGVIVSTTVGALGAERLTVQEFLDDGIPVRQEITARQVLTPATSASLVVGDRPTPQLDAFESAARAILSQPGASRLSAAQIEIALAEVAQRQAGSQIKVVHREGDFPLTLVDFAGSDRRPILIAFWWPERPVCVSQRLVNGARLTESRLRESGQGWELGLIMAGDAATDPAPEVWLHRLADNRWLPLWSSAWAPDWSHQPSQATFADDRLDRLGVREQAAPVASPVFQECPTCAHRQTQSWWERQGDSYNLVQRTAVGSPFAVLWSFLDRLRRGDETGASALCADADLVPVATSLGLDVPASPWVTANRAEDLQIDFARSSGAFRANLVARGSTWRISGIARASAQGRLLLTESSRGSSRRIISLDPDRGEPLALDTGARYAWSPDYRLVAYESGGQVCVISAVGAGSQCALAGSSPVWSPGGDRLLVERSGDGGLAIWQTNVDGSMPRMVARGGSPAWSPDGKVIAFSVPNTAQGHTGIAVISANGGAPTIFTTDGRQPGWSADGSQLAFITSADLVVTIDWATGAITPLRTGQSFRWSPRNREIAVVDAGQLFIAGAGLASRQPMPWEDVVSVSWSPDGSRLAVGRSNHQVWLLGSDGAQPRKLADGDGPVWAAGP